MYNNSIHKKVHIKYSLFPVLVVEHALVPNVFVLSVRVACIFHVKLLPGICTIHESTRASNIPGARL